MLSVDCAQVGIIKQACQIVFGSLLQCLDVVNLEVQVVCSRCLGNFAHQGHKRSLADEELGAPLISMYLVESHCTWPVHQGPL